MPYFQLNLKFDNYTMFKTIFAQSCTAHAQNDHFQLAITFLTENLKFPWFVCYSTTKFCGTCGKIYTCSGRKTAFVMQNFQNLGARGGEYTFLVATPKKHILGRFRTF